MNKLTHWMADKSYQTNSDFIVAVFNGPLTLPTAQRNEVWGKSEREIFIGGFAFYTKNSWLYYCFSFV